MLREKLGGLNKKRLILVSIAIFIFLSGLAFFHSYLSINQNHLMARKYLEAITGGVKEAIDAWLAEQKQFIKMVGNMPLLRESLKNSENGIPDRQMRELGLQMQMHSGLFLADRNGDVIIDSQFSNRKKDLNIKNSPFWKEFKESGFKTIVPGNIERSPVTGELVSLVVTGIRDNQGKLIGYLGKAIDWEHFIEKFIMSVKVGDTGYVAITDLNGVNIGHPDKRLNLIDLSGNSWMQKIIKRKNGYQAYRFQGIDKIMAYRESKESGWIVNTSINEEELIEGTIYIRKVLIVTAVVSLVVMVLLIGYIDASKLGKAQKELKESEKKYRLIFNMGYDGIFVHNIEDKTRAGNFSEVNRVFEDIFGWSSDKLKSITAGDLFTSIGKWDYDSFVRDVYINKYRMMEVEFDNCKGEELIAEFRAFLLETPEKTALLGFVRDITERTVSRRMLKDQCDRLDIVVKNRTRELAETNVILKQQILEKESTERALRDSEEKYRCLVERANDGIMLVKERKVIFANNKIQEILGYSEPEIIDLDLIRLIPEDQRTAIDMLYRKRMAGIIPNSIYATNFLRKDGTVIDVEVNAGLVNYEGSPANFAFIRDITERKRTERERQKHQEELIQTDKLVALGTLVSGVAHEINNPNNAIMLNSPILFQAWLDVRPVLEEYLNENGEFLISGMPYSQFRSYVPDMLNDIQDSSGRIKAIVDGLKNFARPSSLEMTEDVDINMVVESSAKLILNQINRCTDNFVIDLSKDLPVVKGNFQRLEQVLVNLIQNACHALKGKAGQVAVITIYNIEDKVIEVHVNDTGCGIESDNLNKIMDPFFTTKRESGGTGLGLSVSMSIIKKHGGNLRLESEVGVGTKAILTLPVRDSGEDV